MNSKTQKTENIFIIIILLSILINRISNYENLSKKTKNSKNLNKKRKLEQKDDNNPLLKKNENPFEKLKPDHLEENPLNSKEENFKKSSSLENEKISTEEKTIDISSIDKKSSLEDKDLDILLEKNLKVSLEENAPVKKQISVEKVKEKGKMRIKFVVLCLGMYSYQFSNIKICLFLETLVKECN